MKLFWIVFLSRGEILLFILYLLVHWYHISRTFGNLSTFPLLVIIALPAGCFRWCQRKMPWTGSHSTPSNFDLSMKRFFWSVSRHSQSWTASVLTQTGALPTLLLKQAWESVSNITMCRGKISQIDILFWVSVIILYLLAF